MVILFTNGESVKTSRYQLRMRKCQALAAPDLLLSLPDLVLEAQPTQELHTSILHSFSYLSQVKQEACLLSIAFLLFTDFTYVCKCRKVGTSQFIGLKISCQRHRQRISEADATNLALTCNLDSPKTLVPRAYNGGPAHWVSKNIFTKVCTRPIIERVHNSMNNSAKQARN